MILDDKVLDLTLNGKIYKLRYPSVERLEAMAEQEKKAPVKAIREMLVESGLPETIAKKLQAWQMNEIAKELTTTKK